MYDELVKDLRYLAKVYSICENENTKEYKLAVEAADAIEELQKDLERSKDFEAFWQHEAEEALKKFQVAISNKPRWIPVSERLPEYMVNVLVTDGEFSGMGWRDFYIRRDTGVRDEYWLAPNCNVSDENISHWMPLPETPKEK